MTTGNNDADCVYLLHWARRRVPERAERLRARLLRWGGNSSGVNVANIDNLGNVHADTMWWHHSFGNVKDRPCVDGSPLARVFLERCTAGWCGHVSDLAMRLTRRRP